MLHAAVYDFPFIEAAVLQTVPQVDTIIGLPGQNGTLLVEAWRALAAMLAATQGMGISYVGPDLPASEIVEAVKAADAHVLVLGLTRARTRQESARELAAIARGIPAEVEIWVGGPAATHHAPSFASRALVLADFDAYEKQLARLTAGA
jgi:hypothetical protein